MADSTAAPSSPSPSSTGRAAAQTGSAGGEAQAGADVARGIGAIFGLAGFAMSLVSSLFAGAAALDALTTAILSMLVCFIVGYVYGVVLAGVIREHNRDYEKRNPIPQIEPEPIMEVEPIEDQPNENQPSSATTATAKTL